MAPTTRDLWLQDRQGVLDRRRDRAWMTSLEWVSASGLMCAVMQWGWRIPAAAALTVAAMAAFAALPFRLHESASGLPLVDDAVHVGLVLTGAAGIYQTSAPLGLCLTVVLVAMAPRVRRGICELAAILRWSHENAQEVRWDASTTRPHRIRPPYS